MWLERLAVNAKVLSSIPASSDTVESEGRQLKQCWMPYIKKKKIQKSPPKKIYMFQQIELRFELKTAATARQIYGYKRF